MCKFVVGALCVGLSFAAPAAIIYSIAGGGSGGGYATRISLPYVRGVAVTAGGEMYVTAQTCAYRISPQGVATLIAGGGTAGYGGDGGPAVDAQLNDPRGIAVDMQGNVYVADTGNNRIRKITPGGLITTVAGTGAAGFSGDGGAALAASLSAPMATAIDSQGSLYIADGLNNRIRKVTADGLIATVAGNGTNGYFGDGGNATDAGLSFPSGLTFDAAGSLLIADRGNERVRKVTEGRIETLAGGGTNTAATTALDLRLRVPTGVAADASGNVFVVENVDRVLKVAPDGSVTVTAGRIDSPYFGGDGGDATNAYLNSPYHVAIDVDGNIYVSDTNNGRIRKVELNSRGLPHPIGDDVLDPFQRIAVPSKPDNVRIGDVNGDGLNDLVLTTTSATTGADAANDYMVMVYAQRPDGSLAAPLKTRYISDASAGSSKGLELADFNRDGLQDAVVATGYNINVLLGARGGGLTVTTIGKYTGAAAYGNVVKVIDVNLDGYLDVLSLSILPGNPDALTVFYGDGRGKFPTQGTLPKPYSPTNLVLGDFNGDGINDLMMPDSGRGYIYRHDGISRFEPIASSVIRASSGSAAGNFTGDKRDDLITFSSNYPHSNIWLYQQVDAGALQFTSQIAVLSFSDVVTAQTADLNNDGRDDLLAAQGGRNTLAYFRNTELGLADAVEYPMPNVGAFAVGDINADGCADVAAADPTGGLVLLYGKNCARAATTDINGDGKSDLLWRDDARQNFAMWLMDGARKTGGIGYAVPPEWRVLATGDFHGDRKLDVLWTNGTQMQLWEGDGTGGFRGTAMRDYPVGWRVVAAGDISGDGKTDLLWRNEDNTQAGLWVMNGAKIIDSAGYSTGQDWWVVGSGDLSGDGRLDVIWTNGVQMQLWQARPGLTFTGEAMPAYPAGWELVGTGDVTGDGTADLMWRQPEIGYFALWSMDGGTQVFGQGYQPGPSWRVAQTGDFTGDGRTDVIWTNGTSMQLWESHGLGFLGVSMSDYPQGWSVIRR